MYKITKSYEDLPSRNKVEVNDLTLRQAKFWLQSAAKFWKDHSGIVESQTDDELTVTEGSGENRITFKIEAE